MGGILGMLLYGMLSGLGNFPPHILYIPSCLLYMRSRPRLKGSKCFKYHYVDMNDFKNLPSACIASIQMSR